MNVNEIYKRIGSCSLLWAAIAALSVSNTLAQTPEGTQSLGILKAPRGGSSSEQRAAARERWRNLSEEERQKLRERYDQWKNLGPERKEELRERYHRLESAAPEEKAKIRKNWERFQGLNDEERSVLRKKFQRWQNLSPEERQRFLRNRERWQQMPEARRQELRERHQRTRELPRERPNLNERPTARPDPGARTEPWREQYNKERPQSREALRPGQDPRIQRTPSNIRTRTGSFGGRRSGGR